MQRVWRTADGGDSWFEAGIGPNPQGCVSALEAIDDRHAWLSGCALHRTTDGGATWTDVTPGQFGGSSEPPTFFNPAIGRIITPTCDGTGCIDTLHRTADGGLTWQSNAIPPTVSGFGTSYQFLSPERGFRMVQDGGGLFAVSRQRLYRFIGAGPDDVPPPIDVDVTPPDTGAGPRRDGEAFAVLVLISGGGALALLAGLELRRRQR